MEWNMEGIWNDKLKIADDAVYIIWSIHFNKLIKVLQKHLKRHYSYSSQH